VCNSRRGREAACISAHVAGSLDCRRSLLWAGRRFLERDSRIGQAALFVCCSERGLSHGRAPPLMKSLTGDGVFAA
jgi:hypothetical protein